MACISRPDAVRPETLLHPTAATSLLKQQRMRRDTAVHVFLVVNDASGSGLDALCTAFRRKVWAAGVTAFSRTMPRAM
jgi:hypothetical protein